MNIHRTLPHVMNKHKMFVLTITPGDRKISVSLEQEGFTCVSVRGSPTTCAEALAQGIREILAEYDKEKEG